MSTLRTAGRALQAGFGLTLLAALALMSGCVYGDTAVEPEQSGETSIGEAEDALSRALPAGIFRCNLIGGLLAGTLVVYPGPWARTTCAIYNGELAGSSKLFCNGRVPFMACPECQDLRDSFTCPSR
jgi:hypothetical protein